MHDGTGTYSLKSLAARAAKAEQTRRAKAAGTWQPPTPRMTPKKSRKAQDDELMPTPGWRQLTPPPIVLGDEDDEQAGSPTPGPSRAAAAPGGPIHISDNDNNDELMFMEPKTPTRRSKKRALHDEDEDEKYAVIFATPPPPSLRQQQQLPTPLSPLGGVDPLSIAGASTPSPSARKKRRGRRQPSSSSIVKQETNTVGGVANAYDDSAFGLGTALKQEQVVKGVLQIGKDDEVKPSLSGKLLGADASGSAGALAQAGRRVGGLALLSPGSNDDAFVVGVGGAPGQGGVKKEEEEEITITRNDGRPARRGAKRDYSVYA